MAEKDQRFGGGSGGGSGGSDQPVIDNSGALPRIRWGVLTGRLSRGIVYTLFLAALHIVVAFVNGVDAVVTAAVTWFEGFVRALGNPGLIESGFQATAAAIPDSAFGFVAALVVAFAAIWALNVVFKVVMA